MQYCSLKMGISLQLRLFQLIWELSGLFLLKAEKPKTLTTETFMSLKDKTLLKVSKLKIWDDKQSGDRMN